MGSYFTLFIGFFKDYILIKMHEFSIIINIGIGKYAYYVM